MPGDAAEVDDEHQRGRRPETEDGKDAEDNDDGEEAKEGKMQEFAGSLRRGLQENGLKWVSAGLTTRD